MLFLLNSFRWTLDLSNQTDKKHNIRRSEITTKATIAIFVTNDLLVQKGIDCCLKQRRVRVVEYIRARAAPVGVLGAGGSCEGDGRSEGAHDRPSPGVLLAPIHFFFWAFWAALVTFPPEASFLVTVLMTPTATVCFMSRTAKRPRGG
jgi:hypothetical protein